MAQRIRRGVRQQTIAQRMLVASAGRVEAALVLAKRFGEEARLPVHAFGAAIDCLDVGAAQRLLDQLLKSTDLLHVAAQQIVKAQHLANESGTQLEPDVATAGAPRARGRLREDVAFES